MSNFVLVHGAWHGGWCWREVANLLRDDGHRVFTPTLTGLGERAHLLSESVNLDTHIQDIIGVLECEELDDTVLVGHSYGGMPVTGAADALPSRISALVYLDALTPSDGDSVLSVSEIDTAQLGIQSDSNEIPPPDAGAFGLNGELAKWAERQLTPQPLLCATQPIRLSGVWRTVPSKLYIRARQYNFPIFDQYFAAARKDPDWATLEYDVPHNVMMTDPEWFAELLRDHVL
jgi:pimeloyl-ACP methyl ester carboxylesterase